MQTVVEQMHAKVKNADACFRYNRTELYTTHRVVDALGQATSLRHRYSLGLFYYRYSVEFSTISYSSTLAR